MLFLCGLTAFPILVLPPHTTQPRERMNLKGVHPIKSGWIGERDREKLPNSQERHFGAVPQTLYNEKPNEQKVSSHVWTAFPFPASPPHTTQPSERIWKACTLSSQVELVKETACGRIKTPKRDISVPSKRSSSPSQKFCSFSKNSWKNSGRNKKAGPKARMKLVSRCHCVTRFSGQMFNFWGQKITRQKLRKSIHPIFYPNNSVMG